MPVYNGEAFIEEALDSLLAQTYADFELIISDNASTDRTESICRDYVARDPRVRYYRLEDNLGAVPNFNRVFELSDCEYFKWAAVDDVCAVTFLARCVETLDSDSSIAWCHTRSTHIDANGCQLDDSDAVDVSYADREAESAHERFRAVLFDNNNGCLDSYGLIRSHVIQRTPLYLPYYGAEKLFIAELALHGRYQEVPEELFFPRVHAGGSGNLETAAEQQAFMNTRGRRFEWIRFKLLKGYVDAVLRAKLPPSERVRCLLVIGRYLLQVGKWKRILAKTLAGTGIGGGNIERLKRIEERNGMATPQNVFESSPSSP